MLGIKKAYCLCLDKREEHWLDLKRQCESKGLEFNRFLVGKGEVFNPEDYDRLDTAMPEGLQWGYGGHEKDTPEEVSRKKAHHYNAFVSHQAMAKKALEDGDEKVLFLEDDAYFTERFDEVIEKSKEKIENLDYDILYLGWWIGDEGDDFNNTVENTWKEEKLPAVGKAFRIAGLHGIIFSRKMLDIITRLSPINPVDSQLAKFFHDKINSYFIAPKIIHDKGIFSECEQSVTTRHKL